MAPKKKSETEGRVQFSRIVTRRSIRVVAKDLGVKEAALGHWCTGYARPTAALRRAIEKRFGIARALWEVAPKVEHSVVVAGQKGGEPITPKLSLDPEAVDDGDPRAVAAANVRRLRRYLDALETDKNATMKERASISTSLNSATAMLARLSGAIEITPSQIFRSPAWARVKAKFVEAGRPWPDCLEAQGQALLALAGES